MKKYRVMISLILIAAFLVALLAACTDKEEQNTSDFSDNSVGAVESSDADTSSSGETGEPEKDPSAEAKALYNSSVEQLEDVNDFAVDGEYALTRVVGLETFSESGNLRIKYIDFGAEDMKSEAKTQIKYNKNSEISIYEIFCDDTVYLELDNELFVSEMSDDEYTERAFPALLIDSALYTDASIESNDAKTVISFSGATKVETWAASEHAELIKSEAEAVIDENGALIESSCEITYKQGAATVTLSVSAKIEAYTEESLPSIEKPEKDKYLELGNIDIPMYLVRTNKYMLDAAVYAHDMSEVFLCQPAGYVHEASYQRWRFSHAGDNRLKLQSTITTYNSEGSERGEYEDIVINGTTEYDYNGDKGTEKLSADDMLNLLNNMQDDFVGFYPELSDIESADAEITNEFFVIKIEGNEDYNDWLRNYWNEQLFDDEDFLDDLIGGYEPAEMIFSLTIDMDTMLPVAYNIDYGGTYTYEGYDYEMGYEAMSRITIGDPDVYYDISEEFYSDFDEEPDEADKAKPLFYKVTGDNGETMWLLGTIHIGDNRTGYLPDEIYAAFDSSDAAAFEVNIIDMEEQLEEDEDFSELYAESNMYTDGSTVEDHIDEELYDDSMKLMVDLGFGSYGEYLNRHIDHIRPGMLASQIENIYVSQMIDLSSNKGVDMRLLLRGKENGKKIYDIEDREESVSREKDLSDDVMEMLLNDTVYTSRTEYFRGVKEMYETWCSGNYEALDAIINEEIDFTGYDERAIKAYEEYEYSILTERDGKMLDKAVEYLESGETVFFAVGLAHVIGDDSGLLFTLQEAGYTVELVEYAE